MNEDESPDRPHPPAWVALIAINTISFAVVATLVLLSMAVDTFVVDLR